MQQHLSTTTTFLWTTMTDQRTSSTTIQHAISPPSISVFSHSPCLTPSLGHQRGQPGLTHPSTRHQKLPGLPSHPHDNFLPLAHLVSLAVKALNPVQVLMQKISLTILAHWHSTLLSANKSAIIFLRLNRRQTQNFPQGPCWSTIALQFFDHHRTQNHRVEPVRHEGQL